MVVRLQALTAVPKLEAKVFWLPGRRWTEGLGEPGEGLEARSWFDPAWKVTVGTEDAESLASRSRRAKWMPLRLALHFETQSGDVVQVGDDSLSIHLPELGPGERCQFQFVVASGPREDDDSATTWLAVDQRPERLLLAGGCE